MCVPRVFLSPLFRQVKTVWSATEGARCHAHLAAPIPVLAPVILVR